MLENALKEKANYCFISCVVLETSRCITIYHDKRLREMTDKINSIFNLTVIIIYALI